MPQLQPIRRVVTGHDADGRPVVAVDGVASNVKHPDEKVSSTLMWVTDARPDLTDVADHGLRKVGTSPPAGGTRFTIIDIEPGNAFHGQHQTDTIDYVICIKGQVQMALGEGAVQLAAGDVMVQRGTLHAWLNRGDETARVAFVLVDALPKRPGSLSKSDEAK